MTAFLISVIVILCLIILGLGFLIGWAMPTRFM